MPLAPKSPCAVPGCAEYRPCPTHKTALPPSKAADYRMRGRKLQERRQRILAHEPLCRECLKHDRIRAASELDHIVPLHKGGRDHDDNLQPLCHDCHDIKTMHDKGYRVKETQPQGLDW